MKKYLIALVALMMTMFAGNAMAFSPPPPPANGWYVVDQANVLTDAQKSDINHRILAISKVTKNEFGVLILPSMGDSNIEDVANATYRTWGIGKRGLDNGVLIAIAVGERKWRIEVGKGVEGDITDLQASDVGKNHLVPHLRQQPRDWAGGIIESLNTLDTMMETRINAKAQAAAPVPRPMAANNTTNVPVPVLAAPAIAAAPMVTGSTPVSNDGSSTGTVILVVLALLFVVGAFLFWMSLRSSKEEDERREELNRLAREQELARIRNQTVQNRVHVPTATVAPIHTTHTHVTPPVVVTRHTEPTHDNSDAIAAAAITAAAIAAQRRADDLEETRLRQARDREREEASRRRDRDEEDERRRRDDDDSSSSSSSSSSWDSGSSWGGGSDSGGGFGGGDSGGGGSSGDF